MLWHTCDGMKWWCFMPLLCTLFRLNWAKQTPGIMRRNEWRNLPLSGFELATQWSEAQHATAGLRRPPVMAWRTIHWCHVVIVDVLSCDIMTYFPYFLTLCSIFICMLYFWRHSIHLDTITCFLTRWFTFLYHDILSIHFWHHDMLFVLCMPCTCWHN